MMIFAELNSSKQIVQTLSAQLPWSHTVLGMERVKEQEKLLLTTQESALLRLPAAEFQR